jgi:dTDP-4-amino-4,6-dideoxygalactose transaminase
LKVIYDAAHAFGVNCHCGSVLQHGDLSILSFHATKVFNTFEGGAIISQNSKTKSQIDHLKNFGFVDETTVVAAGINGKMSEFNSALGLLQLNHYESSRLNRQKSFLKYRERLEGIIGLTIPSNPVTFTSNYGYFPILINKDYPLTRDELFEQLKNSGIVARRYFYPLISEFPMYRGLESAKNDHLKVAFETSRQVICLPLYTNLEQSTIDKICEIIKLHQKNFPE